MEPRQEPTGLPLPTLQWVGRSIAAVSNAFHLHPEVGRLLDARKCVITFLLLADIQDTGLDQ